MGRAGRGGSDNNSDSGWRTDVEHPLLAYGSDVPAARGRAGAAAACAPTITYGFGGWRWSRRLRSSLLSLLLAWSCSARASRAINSRNSISGSPRLAFTITWASTASVCSSSLLTTFLTPLSILASWDSITKHVKGFFIALLVLETGIIGVFVSLDLFLFFVFWEVMLIPMYFLIGIWGHERRIYAAMKFILYTMFGSILMLVAIVWLYELTGTFDSAANPERPRCSGQHRAFRPHGNAAVRRIFPGVCDQGAAVPAAHLAARCAHRSADRRLRHAGRRASEARAPTACCASACRSSRRPRIASRPKLRVLAIIGIIYGALVAMVQTDLKRLVAYSSVSHLGFVVLGIFAFQATADAWRGLSDAEPRRLHRRAFPRCRHALRSPPHASHQGIRRPRDADAGARGALSCLCVFRSAGLPMLNGFVGEFLILSGTFERHAAWAILGRQSASFFPRSICCGPTSASFSARLRRSAIARCPTPRARALDPVRDGRRDHSGWASAR